MNERKMKIGLSMRYLGYHIAAWRHPDVCADGAIRFDHFLNVAKRAEAEKLDMLFLADGVGVREADVPKGALARSMKNAELEPLTLLAALGACTSRIGLVATASTTYNEPFHVARKFASIDQISGGRAGWNVVTSWSSQEARNFSRDEHLGYELRYERAEEFVDVVNKLWASWEDDAFIRDKQSGIFYDEKKLHPPHHRGKHFQVEGPLNAARTPQGKPIIVQAGINEAGRQLGARVADVIYNMMLDFDSARAYYLDMKLRADRQGRDPSQLIVMPGVTPYVGESRQEAQEKYAQLQELIDPIAGLSAIYSIVGDLSVYDVDGPVPEATGAGVQGLGAENLAAARRDNLTIRQLYQKMTAANSGRSLIGTATDVVDNLEYWFTREAADGFNICPPILPGAMDDLSRFILPELRRRRLFRTEYEASTLRGNLGLRELSCVS